MGALGEPAAQEGGERPGGGGSGDVGGPLQATGHLLQGLAQGLGHETRNSLNALAIHLEVLADKLRDPTSGTLPPHFEKNIVVSRTQIRRLSQIVGQFTEMFGATVVEQRDLVGYLESATSLCSFQLRRADLDLGVDIRAGIQVEVSAKAMVVFFVELLLLLSEAAPGARLVFTAMDEGQWVRIRIDGAPSREEWLRGWRLRFKELRELILAAGGFLRIGTKEELGWTIGLPRGGR